MSYNLYDRSGNLIAHITNSEDAQAILDTEIPNFYKFYLGGNPYDVLKMLGTMNTPDPVTGKSFIDYLEEKYGRVPEEINPFIELNWFFFGNNMIYIQIPYERLVSPALATQMFAVLKSVIPAGSDFNVLLSVPEFTEHIDLQSTPESVEIFYAPQYSENVNAPAETLIPAIT